MNNVVTTLEPSFLIGSFSFLQATRTNIKSRMGLKFYQIRLPTEELAALECLEKSPYGLGAKLRYMGYFASLLHPQEEKVGYYFQSGTCLRALETQFLLSVLLSIFCKWPVINVTPQTLK